MKGNDDLRHNQRRADDRRERGNPFLVMDYIDGQTLDDYLAEKCKVESVKCKVGGGISADEVLRILRPIAAALDYAHGEGVVHRDVKPANVMIRRDGHPFILDFGIAREIQETMTRVTGKLSSGTLLYMSPEQLMGEQPRPAQDVYSFAAMAYECLKGEPPFVRGAIEDQIKNKPPPPLTGKAAILAAGVMAGLAKKPEDRPATCAAVLEASEFSRVEHVDRVDGQNGRARSPSGPQPVGRRVPTPPQSGGPRSRAAVKGLLAAAFLAILAGGAWWLASGRNGTTGTTGTNVVHVPSVSDVPVVPLPASAPRTGEPPTKTFILPGGETMEMVYVAPGSFTMGSPSSEDGHIDDETQHRVTLTKGYWLGKYEGTQRQWESVMGENPSFFKGPDRPVENVSWNDCQKFIAKVDDEARRQFGGGARLPTEAEWEYACRAGSSGPYAGNGNLNDMGWYDGNSGSTTHPVGQKKPNAWGFHDMHGNVWEWSRDWYGAYKDNVNDPQGPASGDDRVLRGGCWINDARDCRSAYRYWNWPGYRDIDYGFRLCCSAGPRGGAEQ